MDLILFVCLNITERLFAIIPFMNNLDFPIHFKDASCGFSRGSKISEILESFGRIKKTLKSPRFLARAPRKSRKFLVARPLLPEGSSI